jgi:TPR repeat protein
MLYSPDSASTLVAKDKAKSAAYYKKACEAGQAMACNVVKASN